MTKTEHLARIERTRLVAILRSASGERLVDVAEAILEGGIEVVEVTFTVPKAVQIIEAVCDRLGDRMLVGAGTVLDAETARAALLAGAEFLVTPTVNPSVIELCRRYGKVVMPGALTPTEILTAWEAGGDVVKVFPSDVTGPGYLRAISGPLPQIPLLPTGGVNLDTAAAFLEAGAFALGVGGSLASSEAIARGDLDQIETTARAFVEVVGRAGGSTS